LAGGVFLYGLALQNRAMAFYQQQRAMESTRQ